MNERARSHTLMSEPAPTLPVGKASLSAFPKSNRPKGPYAYLYSTARPEPSVSSAH